MIPTDPTLRKPIIERMIDECENAKEDLLTEWEHNFVESIKSQYVSRGNLSDRQCEILEKIYDKL
jgi:hypothetical protein